MPSVSQMMAAKRAAKTKRNISAEAGRHIGDGKIKADRNRTAYILSQQAKYRIHLQKGEPCAPDTNITDEIRNNWALLDLTYNHNTTQAVTVFEKLIRAMRVIAKIYEDNELKSIAKAAETAINTINQDENGELSPNQRRTILKPAAMLADYAAAYAQTVPARTVEIIAGYCSAVQIALYTTAFYRRPLGAIDTLFALIKGQSLRQLAKMQDKKETVLRTEMLDLAWYFYRILECLEEIAEPQSIPDLRQTVWQKYADTNQLQAAIRASVDQWLIPFENHTGITLIDYKKFKQDVIRIESINQTIQ